MKTSVLLRFAILGLALQNAFGNQVCSDTIPMEILNIAGVDPVFCSEKVCAELEAFGTSSVPATISSLALLPLSSEGELLTFSWVSTTTHAALEAGRSYNGGDWENSPGLLRNTLRFRCSCSDDPSCGVDVTDLVVGDGNGEWRLERVDTSTTVAPLSAESAARLLTQATFGPTRDTIADLKARFDAKNQSSTKTDLEDETAVIKSWMEEQIGLAPTLHLSYWRKRSNPPMPFGTSLSPGVASEACDLGARYHVWPFTYFDVGKTVTITESAAGVLALTVDGVRRTEFNATFVDFVAGEYTITNVEERLNGDVDIQDGSDNTYEFANAPMNFLTSVPAEFEVVATNNVLFTSIIPDPGASVINQITTCPYSTEQLRQEHIFMLHGTTPLRFDRRLVLLDNTLDDPASVTESTISAAGSCPTVERTFLNEGHCVLRETCAPIEFESTSFTLNEENLLKYWETSAKPVYYLQGLRLESPHDDKPCDETTSRWMITNSPCAEDTDVFGDYKVNVTQILRDAVGVSPYVKDVNLKDVDFPCPTSDDTMGVNITVDDKCYTHVHPDLFNVVDASFFSIIHPGNDLSVGFRPLLDAAQESSVVLNYLADHPMSRWNSYARYLPVLGIYGQTVDFKDLVSDAQAPGMAVYLGATANTTSQGQQACGAPGEIANDPTVGHQFTFYLAAEVPMYQSVTRPYYRYNGKSMVMQNVAVKAEDQLRQRMAWALSQIFVIGEEGLNRREYNGLWHAYNDIFLRHAFGNYRDIMKEVSYSPPMSVYLTYRNNRAFIQSGTQPDENYARELMQLFTIGLYELNQDGSYVRDNDGEPISTYDNDDIMSMARVWTGFETQAFRANLESGGRTTSINMNDPLKIRAYWRDKYPKSSVTGGYIGDGYPLCADLPARHFLRQGARYVKIGDSPVPNLGSTERTHYDTYTSSTSKRLNISADSPLYGELCANSGSGCTYPDEIYLSANLQCDGEECDVDEVRTVKIVDGDNFVWYEYVRRACVELAYYANAKTVATRQLDDIAQCADPVTTGASPICCFKEGTSWSVNWGGTSRGFEQCSYLIEHTTFDKAAERCAAYSHATYGDREVCRTLTMDMGYHTQPYGAPYRYQCGAHDTANWMNTPCSLQVQLRGNGLVSIVHSPNVSAITGLNGGIASEMRPNSVNVLKVSWNGDYPTSCPASCSGDCVCDTITETVAAFTDQTQPPSRETVESYLFIASIPLSEYDDGTYEKCTSAACSAIEVKEGVEIYTHADSNGAWDMKTVFKLSATNRFPDGRYLFNKRSDVIVGDPADGFSFRNIPHFHSLLQTWSSRSRNTVSASEYETEAVLDHLFLHQNTPPFVAFRLIQRFITSNPSPRYIESVADAFESGTYNGETFSGSYGDLKATIMAIFLDPEARAQVLDVAAGDGQLREPLLKVLHLFRSLEFEMENDWQFELHNMEDKIGQQSKRSPSVFNFYQPTYSPLGPLQNSGLYSPESQLGTAPFLLGFLNGVRDLFNRGLTGWSDGFGRYEGNGDFSIVHNTTTADAFVNELNLLLAAGRMSANVIEHIKATYTTILAEDGEEDAIHSARMLAATSSEFHSSQGRSKPREGYARDRTSGVESQGREYKAIVIVFKYGGCDSWNVLTPYSDCGDNGGYEEYTAVRTNVALPKSGTYALRPITADSSQPCGTLGINPAMETVERLYNAGDALMLANVGTLVEPITKDEYNAKAKRVPSSLFAHNVQQTHTQTVYAGVSDKPDGILGRIVQALREQAVPWRASSYSIYGIVDMLTGKYGPDILTSGGVKQYRGYSDNGEAILDMVRNETASAFAETHNALVERSLEKTEALGDVLDSTTISTSFPDTSIGKQFNQAALIIKAREALNNTERDVFFLGQGGFDTHADAYEGQYDKLKEIDDGLESFEAEMKDQGLWDNVVVMTASDFARTMLSNGAGTDHAWGGNYWMAGGAVNGGQIVGQFPSTLDAEGPLSISRAGRLVPTTSWEAVWSSIAEWFGVEESQMNDVLPNRPNFPPSDMFREEDLFKTS